MSDVNLHTLNFVRSTTELDKSFLIDDSTGDPEYFRLKVPEGTESRIELYHAPTLAPLGVFQHLSSKLNLISLTNPATTIELKKSGYIQFEWTFYFDKILKFCWREDIFGLAGTKRGFTCWMTREPDPDYPCAIYKPGSSTVRPFCQFLDFNIRRIDGLQDPRGLKYVILLSLLGLTEAPIDQDAIRHTPEPLPRSQNQVPFATIPNTPTKPIELQITGHRSTSDLVTQGLKLFDDPLFLHLSVLAPSPKEFKQAIHVAEQIKRDRLKKSGEELHQYVVDNTVSQEISQSSTLSSSSRSSDPASNSLKVYLSRTPLSELVPKSATKASSDKPSKSSLLAPGSTRPSKNSHTRQEAQPQTSPKGQRQVQTVLSSSATSPTSPLHSRLVTGVHRPFIKMISIATNSSRSSAFYHNHITPYYFEEDEATKPEVGARQDEKVKDAIETTEPLTLHRDSRVNLEKEKPRVSKNYDSSNDSSSFTKKPEPFLICTNELNATPNLPVQMNRIHAKDGAHICPDQAETRRRRLSPDLISDEECASQEGGTRNSVNISSSNESIRSRSSTIKSTASSFVEIILSSCCSAYSSSFKEEKEIGSARKIKKNGTRPRCRDSQSPTTPTWKRFSHLGNRQSLVSHLFS